MPPETLARLVFRYENGIDQQSPVSGAQDALGLCMPGVSFQHYDAGYWPQVQSVADAQTLRWLEASLSLYQLHPRPPVGRQTSAGRDSHQNFQRRRVRLKVKTRKAFDPFLRLFWRTQIGILSACPPMLGVVIKHSLTACYSPKLWLKTLLKLALHTPQALLLHWDNKRRRRTVLGRVSIVVTTRCTLRCDKCFAHVPDLKQCRDLPVSVLLEDIQNLFSCVDYIYAIVISGGEAFLHPNLDEIIRACASSGKTDDISVQSNGTLIPNAKVLAALAETNTTVKISNYPKKLQPNVKQLKAVLKENGIHYTHESGTSWRDLGPFGQRQKGSGKKRFSACVLRMCVPVLNGKIHLCAQSSILMEEGFIQDCPEEYINLRTTKPAEFRQQWNKLQNHRVISACSYCAGAYESPVVPVAEQREG